MEKKNPIVTIELENGGVMTAELYPDVAPNTVNNFISLINKGFFVTKFMNIKITNLYVHQVSTHQQSAKQKLFHHKAA